MDPRRGRAARPPARVLLVDAALAVVLAGLMTLYALHAPQGGIPPYPRQSLDGIAYTLMGLSAGALVLRRAWPFAALAITAVSTAMYFAIPYPYGPIFFAPVVAVYSIARYWPVRRSAGACALATMAIAVGHVLGEREPDWIAALPLWLAGTTGWLLAPWALGLIVGFRREADIRAREEEARRYADEERLRIAREVHDVVGHGLAAINMQAGVALHVLDRRPEQARPALEAIKKSSKDALDELRSTLAVFRQPGGPEDTDAPTRPTPGLGQLDTLISSTNESGLPVTVEVTGSHDELVTIQGDGSLPALSTLPTLPAAVDVAVYRIVQVSLTNVLRHAGPASATVRIERQPGDVLVEVVDNGQARPESDTLPDGDPAGHGIAGMRERATAVGGTLEAGPRTEGGFRVRARLPAGDGDPSRGKR